jgi:hypothetical protein
MIETQTKNSQNRSKQLTWAATARQTTVKRKTIDNNFIFYQAIVRFVNPTSNGNVFYTPTVSFPIDSNGEKKEGR